MATGAVSSILNPRTTLPGMTGNNRKFDTGIPGFDILSNAASANVQDLLAGTESPAITQNINAQWGVGAGVPGSEFLKNRAIDLYGQRSEARKQQGLQNLLGMLQGYSGTVTARPGEILSAESQGANRALEQSLAEANRGESARQFDISTALNAALQRAQLGLQSANVANNFLNSYLSFLQ